MDPGLGEELDTLENVGRRSAARLRLSIPARLVTIAGTRRCIMIDLSRGGAQIGLPSPLGVGEAGFLHFAHCEAFGTVVREGPGVNGLEFDVSLSDADVLKTRGFAESYESDQRKALLREARAWVAGT